jgi:hypothetical protein
VLAAVLMFGACSLFTGSDNNATVNAVIVSPAAGTVVKGGTQIFTAAVAGTGDYAQTVTWKVGGGAETVISGAGVLTVAGNETASILTVTATSTMDTSKSGTAVVTVTGGDDPNLARAKQFRDELNAIAPGSVEVDSVYSTYVNVVADLTLININVSVPAGVGLSITGGKTLTVDTGATLDLTDGGLILENNATLTVNGTINAKAAVSITSFGIAILPGVPASATINGSGIIHLKTQGPLLAIMAGETLILDGTVTLDGLRTIADGGTDAGDTMNNVGHVVFVAGELDMQGGTITGNYNTATYDGGGVEVNGGYGGTAKFTMSGSAKVSGNRTIHDGGGVNVCNGGTFIMKGSAEVSNNTAGDNGGGVYVGHATGSSFTMEGGTIYGSSAGTDANTASGLGDSLYVNSVGGSSGTAEWGGSVSTHTINGFPSGSAGSNIISSGSTENNTIYAVSP